MIETDRDKTMTALFTHLLSNLPEEAHGARGMQLVFRGGRQQAGAVRWVPEVPGAMVCTVIGEMKDGGKVMVEDYFLPGDILSVQIAAAVEHEEPRIVPANMTDVPRIIPGLRR